MRTHPSRLAVVFGLALLCGPRPAAAQSLFSGFCLVDGYSATAVVGGASVAVGGLVLGIIDGVLTVDDTHSGAYAAASIAHAVLAGIGGASMVALAPVRCSRRVADPTARYAGTVPMFAVSAWFLFRGIWHAVGAATEPEPGVPQVEVGVSGDGVGAALTWRF